MTRMGWACPFSALTVCWMGGNEQTLYRSRDNAPPQICPPIVLHRLVTGRPTFGAVWGMLIMLLTPQLYFFHPPVSVTCNKTNINTTGILDVAYCADPLIACPPLPAGVTLMRIFFLHAAVDSSYACGAPCYSEEQFFPQPKLANCWWWPRSSYCDPCCSSNRSPCCSSHSRHCYIIGPISATACSVRVSTGRRK